MQVSEFMLKLDMIMGVAADVARAARTRAHIVQSIFHRADDVGMLSHAKIIVRAPNGDVFGTIMSGKAARVGVAALIPQYVDEYAIATLCMEPVNRLFENSVIIHGY